MDASAEVEFTKTQDYESPVCPSCKQEIRELKYKQRGWRELIPFQNSPCH